MVMAEAFGDQVWCRVWCENVVYGAEGLSAAPCGAEGWYLQPCAVPDPACDGRSASAAAPMVTSDTAGLMDERRPATRRDRRHDTAASLQPPPPPPLCREWDRGVSEG